MSRSTPAPIEDYAMIGDCETAALVSRAGSIDWLCWPRFDSNACFAALLGDEQNGRWLLAPRDAGMRCTRRYRGDTLVLETLYEGAEGAVRVVDFMPIRGHNSDLVRTVQGVRGRVEMGMELVIRYDYGSVVPWVHRADDGSLLAIAGPDMIVLRGDVETHGENLTTVSEFAVSAGDSVSFTLGWAPSHHAPPKPVDPGAALRETEKFWTEWMGRCGYRGEWWDAVARSLLTLKALTYRPTGGVVAAATTSLPEQIGGARNWDYRFCWLRDATLTLLALMDAGYFDEAGAWRDWLLRAVAGSPKQVQIMYGVAGERMLPELEIPWLRGYEASKPVRIGNAAHTQLQLDVYGELMDALHQARKGGIPESDEGWRLETALTQHIAETWEQADRGIWEVRGAPRDFTHSKVMSWVALDRAIKSAEEFGLEAPVDDWRRTRARIHREVCERGFNASVNSFTQSFDSRQVDAALLQLPIVGFLPPTDPRILGTIERIERELLVDGFVLRYDTSITDDGLAPGEGAFLACSFWLADAYMLIGREADARRLFDRLLALRNDVGLLSEQYDPHTKRLVGNFPQAFSHVALVDTALNLGQEAAQNAPKPAEQRGDGHRAKPR